MKLILSNETPDTLLFSLQHKSSSTLLTVDPYASSTASPAACTSVNISLITSEKADILSISGTSTASAAVPLSLGAKWTAVRTPTACPWRIYRTKASAAFLQVELHITMPPQVSKGHYKLSVFPRRDLSSFLSQIPDTLPLSSLLLPGTHDTCVEPPILLPCNLVHILHFSGWRSTAGQYLNASLPRPRSRCSCAPASAYWTSASQSSRAGSSPTTAYTRSARVSRTSSALYTTSSRRPRRAPRRSSCPSSRRTLRRRPSRSSPASSTRRSCPALAGVRCGSLKTGSRSWARSGARSSCSVASAGTAAAGRAGSRDSASTPPRGQTARKRALLGH